MTDKWKALERLRERAAGGNHADEDCNIINLAFRDLEQKFFDAIKDNAEVARLNADLAVANIALEQRVEKYRQTIVFTEEHINMVLENWDGDTDELRLRLVSMRGDLAKALAAEEQREEV